MGGGAPPPGGAPHHSPRSRQTRTPTPRITSTPTIRTLTRTRTTVHVLTTALVTGHSWQHEVRHRILRPLRLHDTSAPAADPRIRGAHLKGCSAFGESGPVIDVTELNPSGPGAAGGMTGTTDDPTRFYRALMEGRLLKPAQPAETRTTVRAAPMDPARPGARYGLGLMEIRLTCGGGYYSHGGDLFGCTTRNGFSSDGRRVVVVAATGDGSSSDPGTHHAANTLIDEQLCAADRT
ncbi:serine hydrolase domain-containing protein [Streptomyces sp. NPDC058632]|uniref:serine hydrolase domain-containing protein n=1 Tax=Streptomyces sp. NPDC058632 TaxID=3346567 RepID=UPI0036642453